MGRVILIRGQRARFAIRGIGAVDVTIFADTTNTARDLLIDQGVVIFTSDGAADGEYLLVDDVTISGGDLTLIEAENSDPIERYVTSGSKSKKVEECGQSVDLSAARGRIPISYGNSTIW